MTSQPPQPCRFCRHNVHQHNNIQGCPYCKCSATRIEGWPVTDREDRRPVLPPERFWKAWQQPDPVEVTVCSLCKKDPATGTAYINDDRYCHGDEDPEPTCYQVAQWRSSFGQTILWLREFFR